MSFYCPRTHSDFLSNLLRTKPPGHISENFYLAGGEEYGIFKAFCWWGDGFTALEIHIIGKIISFFSNLSKCLNKLLSFNIFWQVSIGSFLQASKHILWVLMH